MSLTPVQSTGFPELTAGGGPNRCAKCGLHLGDFLQPSHYCIDGVCLIPPRNPTWGRGCEKKTPDSRLPHIGVGPILKTDDQATDFQTSPKSHLLPGRGAPRPHQLQGGSYRDGVVMAGAHSLLLNGRSHV